MKRQVGVVILLLTVACAKANADDGPIVRGTDIAAVSKSMAEFGCKETFHEMLATQINTDLKRWSVGQVVLIVVYQVQKHTLEPNIRK